MKIAENQLIRQFVKFGLVGASSTIIDWSIYFILTRILGVYYVLAKVISFLVAVTNSYLLNRTWTFRSSSQEKGKEFIKFITVSVIGLGLNTGILYLSVNYLKLSDIIGLVLATVMVTFWNFSINRLWVFKEVQ